MCPGSFVTSQNTVSLKPGSPEQALVYCGQVFFFFFFTVTRRTKRRRQGSQGKECQRAGQCHVRQNDKKKPNSYGKIRASV